jgi:adenylosuccinate lyase
VPDQLNSISPLDGRYNKDVAVLSYYFSESALMRYRLQVEIEYLIALSNENKITALPTIPNTVQTTLRKLYEKFDSRAARRIKKIEAQTNHDVKAIEQYLGEKLHKININKFIPWVHFGLTSEDVNNLAYSLMWRDGIKYVYLPMLNALQKEINKLSRLYGSVAMLALTHGQAATPTTFGKEMAVFHRRLNRQATMLKEQRLQGKINGATGTWAAHTVAYPAIDWIRFTGRLVKRFGLDPNPVTTQIEPHDSLAESYHILARINSILIDFTQDMWLYISRAILGQKKIPGETGSSTMPHKINPIYFENAEGNCGVANALLNHLASKLTVSRMQRDLSGSTVIRNQGVALGHSFVGLNNLLKGLDRITINQKNMSAELDKHWEVLAEAIQTILRKNGHPGAYNKLKNLTRGNYLDQETIHKLISDLNITTDDKNSLQKLTPADYTGLANKLARLK